jgi:23S rRNA (guanosine2251-2'-O)-methyltransferase
MAEFWVGNSPKDEIRRHGHFYPSCKAKCEPILNWAMQGLDVEPNPLENAPQESSLDIVYEDDFLLVVNKPEGVLSVPGKLSVDSIQEQVQRLYPEGEKPLIVICDEISDPHNLGAIIRTAECAGAHGIVIPKRRSAGLTAVVAKTSAGAVAHMPVARVANIPSLIKDLKKQGVWVFGTAAKGTTDLYKADLKGAAAIVIGSEGDGMTRLAEENCDFLVSIPMKGKINSLNASAAAAILLYEAVRQRLN